MDNYNDFNELEEMRQQIKALKEKVESKGILNERLVKKSIRAKMRSIHSIIYWLIAMCAIVSPVWIMIKFQYNLSWPYLICTLLMMYVSLFFDWYVSRMDVERMFDDLKETARKLVQMKKRRSLHEKIGLLVVIPLWLLWTGYEFYTHVEDPLFAKALLIGLVIGGVIGAIIGISIYFKMQRKNTEILEEIESITEEE